MIERPVGSRLARLDGMTRLRLGVLALAALGAAAQEPPTIPVETQVVHVEVVVTDKHGGPVPGLTAADFALFQDGRPVAITDFQAPQGAVAGPATGAGATARAATARPFEAGEPLTFVVYLDDWNLTPQDRARVIPGLTSFLKEQLARGGTRALVISAGAETRLLSPLTTDARTVATAFEAAQKEPTHGQLTRSDERQVVDTVRTLFETLNGPCEENLPAFQQPIRFHAQLRSRELQETLARLEAVTRALGTLPGSKAVFYVSDGLEQRPAVDLFNLLGDVCPAALNADFSMLLAPMRDYDMSRAFRALASRANAARVTLYPVDAAGTRGSSLADPEWSDRSFVPSTRTDAMRVDNLKSGQFILADETGGVAVFDANQVQKPLEQLAGQIRGEYSLGFDPGHAPEGRVHVLRVELREKGLRVRYTPTYLHGARVEPGVSRTLAALLVGLEEDTLGANVSLDPLQPSASKASVRIGVPLARLTAVEDATGRHGRVRVVIAVWRADAKPGESPFEVREKLFDVPLPQGAGAAQPDRELVVEPPLLAGHRELAVGVLDVRSRLVTYKRLAAP
jgi:VWFA-related protein